MRILVTGGAGFIGSNIVKTLVEEGDEVVVIDSLITGKKENLKPFLDKIKFIEGSILDDDKINEALAGVDYVLHQAALPSVPRSLEQPLASLENNLSITLKILVKSVEFKIKKLVYASSSSIYGNQDKLPLVETMNPGPMSPYALHKLVGEHYCGLFNNIYGMETISLRYFNVYGPRQSPDGGYACLIPKFIKILEEGEQPVINGDGGQTRDFTYVGDVANANILAATTKNKLAFGEAFNIGNGKNVSVNEVAERIIKLSGKKIKAVYGPGVIEPKDTLADFSKAYKVLGWKPGVEFEEGLKRTYDFMIRNKG